MFGFILCLLNHFATKYKNRKILCKNIAVKLNKNLMPYLDLEISPRLVLVPVSFTYYDTAKIS